MKLGSGAALQMLFKICLDTAPRLTFHSKRLLVECLRTPKVLAQKIEEISLILIRHQSWKNQ